MMGEVVDHGYPSNLTFYLQSTFDALECADCIGYGTAVQPQRLASGDHCKTVPHVEQSRKRRHVSPINAALKPCGESRHVRRKAYILCNPFCFALGSKSLDLAECP